MSSPSSTACRELWYLLCTASCLNRYRNQRCSATGYHWGQPGNYTDLTGVHVFFWVLLGWTQVRDEYAHFLSCICTSQKKRYSDFSSTNPSSSHSQVSTVKMAACCLQNEPSFCCLTYFLFVLGCYGPIRLPGAGSTQDNRNCEAFYLSSPFAVQQRGSKVVQRFGSVQITIYSRWYEFRELHSGFSVHWET